jgi:hypothetical protein
MKKFFLVAFFAIFLAAIPIRTLADSVSIQPSTESVSVGNSFTLNVDITSVTDLYDFQFDIGFNPYVLSVTGITEGSFLPGGGSTFFIPGAIDNVSGSIAFNADTLLGPGPGVNGSGTLLTVDFTAIGSGSSDVTLANLIFQDSTGDSIGLSATNGTVNVTGLSTVPEPSTLLTIGAGLVFLVLLKRRNNNAVIPQ